MEILSWGFIILSLVITGVICSILNKNSVGTAFAYIKRFVIVWVFVCAVMAMAVSKFLPSENEPVEDIPIEERCNSNSPGYIKIDDKQYLFSDITLEFIKNFVPNGSYTDNNMWEDPEGKLCAEYSNEDNPEAVTLVLSRKKGAAVYKDVSVGMKYKEVMKRLGDADVEDVEGIYMWYFYENGATANASSFDYVVFTAFDNKVVTVVGIMDFHSTTYFNLKLYAAYN